MNFIKKIFENQVDELVHKQFTRFSIGEYPERALISIKKRKDLNIKTSFEFCNDFVQIISNDIKEPTQVSGKIITTFDFENNLDIAIEKYEKKGKLFTAEIKTILTPDHLKNLYENFKDQWLLFNINSKNFKLSCGKSLPKPGKQPKDNFCKATLPLNLLNEFAFDIKQDFKNLKIKHFYLITDIITPEQYKNDPVNARLYGKRKGKIIREIQINGKTETKEREFLV